MAGTWIMTRQNGKAHGTPFTFNADELYHFEYNAPAGERYVFQNVITLETRRIAGKRCPSVRGDEWGNPCHRLDGHTGDHLDYDGRSF